LWFYSKKTLKYYGKHDASCHEYNCQLFVGLVAFLCHLIKKSSSDDLRLRTLEYNGERLRVFQQKILRKIIGPLKTSDKQYQSRYNQELYQLNQEPDIAATVQHRRLL
jgi:hypothetical protein